MLLHSVRTFGGGAGFLNPLPAVYRVSVIVATRDRPELLERALAHMSSQVFEAFEVIIVDDGSCAETRDKYVDIRAKLNSRFRWLELSSLATSGQGPSVARNVGIQVASGDIVTFCDDDDFWTDNRHLAMMVNAFDADPEIDLYIGNQCAVRYDGTVERCNWLPDLLTRVQDKLCVRPGGCRIDINDLLYAGGFAQLNIVAVRKATAMMVDGFWTRISYEEDRDFFWRVTDAARAIFFNPTVIAQHNVPDPNGYGNLSRSFSRTERWMIAAMVSQHIAMSVRSTRIRAMSQAYEGDILRHLSRHLLSEGRHALGVQYARRALAARISLKWAIYTCALMCLQIMRKEAV